MKKGLIIGLAATAVAAAVASLVSVGVSAGPVREPAARADAQITPAHEIAVVVRAGVYRLAYNSGPRIIHIPQPDEAVAPGDYRDNVNVNGDSNGDDARHVEDVADPEPPKPVRRTRPAKRSAAPPAVKRHIVTSAPPPPPRAAEDDKDRTLSPVYPTPDFGANVDSGEKFAPPPRQN